MTIKPSATAQHKNDSVNLREAFIKAGLSEEIFNRVQKSLADQDLPETQRNEVKQWIETSQWDKIQDSYFQEIEFGTGGLRGIVGAGCNRMNASIVRRVAQGVSHYIAKNFEPEDRKMVIAYDSRLYSKSFALECATVLAANGITTYIFDDYETTPCLSFAVRHLKCAAGFCLTASHNPPNYAGLKVYGEDGAQIVPPTDKIILNAVAAVHDSSQVQSMAIETARLKKLVLSVPDAVTQAYFAEVKKLETFANQQRKLSIVYTPLHGTGAKPARRVMHEWGFTNFAIVPNQESPDGNFPTVRKPNPEEPEALQMLIGFAEQRNADAGFASDPDSDRLALVSKETESNRSLFSSQCIGNYVLLNGNQTGALLLDFLLSEWKKQGRLPPGSTVIKTIVTSELHRSICKKYGVEIVDTLTGFKWIAAKVRDWEIARSPIHYIFGTEESFGYMPGTYVRDKDGIAALAMAAEMVDFHKRNGILPCEALLKIFEEHGAWMEDLHTVDLDGQSGKNRINAIMKKFRQNPPQAFAQDPVTQIEDYATGEVFQLNAKSERIASPMQISLPKSDVLIFRLQSGGQVSVRPSGTEPKIKFYFSATACSQPTAAENFKTAVQKNLNYKKEVEAFCASI